MGFTEVYVLRTLNGLIHRRYPQGVLYLFPTRDDVTDFSTSRFRPLINDNPDRIGRYLTDTDQANLKRIGRAFLFFRGAQLSHTIEGEKKSSSKLKTIPVDAIRFDEFDEMPPAAIPLALERMSHSTIQEEVYLSTPTIPDYGIDALYQESDQRIWELECLHCGTWTCLELEWPNCLKRQKSRAVHRVCKKCERQIYPMDGRWTPQIPSRSNDHVGRWISQLNSVYIDPRTILDQYEDPKTDVAEFHNSKLGLAYIASENRLTVNDVYSRCREYAMEGKSDEPCAMGVDVGTHLHVVIGRKHADRYVRVLKMIRISAFSDLYELVKRYNVRAVVLDVLPEQRKVREFCAAIGIAAWGCMYSEEQKGAAAYDDLNRVVTVNRTEISDASHDLVAANGGWMLDLPRRNAEVQVFAEQLTHMARVREEDPKTRVVKMRWRGKVGGPDDYRHALNYLMLALPKIPVSRPVDIVRSTPVAPKGKFPW